jgi:hypothetical protein
MELKLIDFLGTTDRRSTDEDGDFVLELTLDDLARVAGGRDDESPKEHR